MASKASRVGGLERTQDCCDNSLQLLIDLVVPETQYAVSRFLESKVTKSVFRIVPLEAVLAPINFDDQALPPTLKVNDIRWNRRLASEMESARTQLT